MALAEAIDTLAGLVAGVTPTVDAALPFYRLDSADHRDVADVALDRPRVFDVVAVGAPRESQFTSGGGLDFVKQDAEVQVGYARAHWRRDHEFSAAHVADLASLVDALRPPSGWSSVAHYVSVHAGETRFEALTDTAGQPVGVVLILPMTIDLEV